MKQGETVDEVDDSTYISSRNSLVLSDAYFKYIKWSRFTDLTGTQADFANWLLEEPQCSKISQIGGLTSVFDDVRRFVRGQKRSFAKELFKTNI